MLISKHTLNVTAHERDTAAVAPEEITTTYYRLYVLPKWPEKSTVMQIMKILRGKVWSFITVNNGYDSKVGLKCDIFVSQKSHLEMF